MHLNYSELLVDIFQLFLMGQLVECSAEVLLSGERRKKMFCLKSHSNTFYSVS